MDIYKNLENVIVGQILPNSIINADCLEAMKLIPNNSVDMILADLPYGTTRNKWDSIIPLDALWEQYNRVIKDNGAIVLTAQFLFSAKLMLSNEKDYKYSWVWKKGNKPTGFLNAKKQPLRICEDVLVFYKNQCTYNPQMTKGAKCHSRGKSVGTDKNKSENYNGYKDLNTEGDLKYPQTLIDFERDVEKLHPTQKPVSLFEYLIKTYSNENDIILDNCSGCGTTAIACLNTNRDFICIEKDEKYFNDSITRINKILMEE